MDTMTKSKLIELVAQRSNITKTKAELVVNCVFDTMTQSLERGDGIEIRGFGSFNIKDYGEYSGHNPRTKEVISVDNKRLPRFKVGKELKEQVNAQGKAKK